MRPAESREREDTPGVPPAPDAAAFLDTFTVAETGADTTTEGRADGPGFRGRLELAQADWLAAEDTVPVLKQLGALIAWAQAQQAVIIHRIETDLRRDIEEGLGRVDGSMALSATAAEVGSALNLPHMSAMALVSESNTLCTVNRSTHAQLSRGVISYRHAQRIMEEVQSVPTAEAPRFEVELIQLAQARTCAQFTARARRLRESRWPETITTRHRQALELRRVSLDPKPDGMAELSALVAAEKGQAIFNTLTAAARTARAAGDERTLDQLRTDVFTSLVMSGSPSSSPRPSRGPHPPAADPLGAAGDPDRWTVGDPACGTACGAAGGPSRDSVCGAAGGPSRDSVCGAAGDPSRDSVCGAAGDPSRDSVCGAAGDPAGRAQQVPFTGGILSGPTAETAVTPTEDVSGIRAEIMVLIDASTLFGADDMPAELNGYGPISAEAARRLARQALHWTGLVKDSSSGEILAVGRRRKVPAGLRRWLQARDGTCRFPGCRVSTGRTEIDHTIPWSQGGQTEHGNLGNLCPKHHRLKTLGLWKAHQPQPGKLEWVSPFGHRYSTDAQLDYVNAQRWADSASRSSGASRRTGPARSPSDDGDPPPF